MPTLGSSSAGDNLIEETDLFNQKALAKVFRARFLEALNRAALPVPKGVRPEWIVDCTCGTTRLFFGFILVPPSQHTPQLFENIGINT